MHKNAKLLIKYSLVPLSSSIFFNYITIFFTLIVFNIISVFYHVLNKPYFYIFILIIKST